MLARPSGCNFAGMFTGIITHTAVITRIKHSGSNLDIWMQAEAAFVAQLRVDQSVAHNGVCLTVAEINHNQYRVTAVAETLQKTTLGNWQKGQVINLELALRVGDRLDGHFVQGHVDGVGTLHTITPQEGSFLLKFKIPEQFAPLLIEKGSICINGVSLTCFDVGDKHFSVAIIPYTWQHTSFHNLKEGDTVNLEFDVLGKYFQRWQQTGVKGMGAVS